MSFVNWTLRIISIDTRLFEQHGATLFDITATTPKGFADAGMKR
jgi:hypothetical protein